MNRIQVLWVTWTLLADWKAAVSELTKGLTRLSDWVREQDEIKERRWLSEEEFKRGEPGVTEWFARTLTLDAAEEACQSRRSWKEWEIVAAPGDRTCWTLQLLHLGTGIVGVAISPSQAELDGLKQVYSTLPEADAVGGECRRITETSRALDKELERISNLAAFPGTCNLCD